MTSARLTAITLAACVVTLALPATTSRADNAGNGDDRTLIVTMDTAKGDTTRAAADAVEAAGGTVSEARAISDRSVAVTVSGVSEATAQVIGEAVADQSGVTAAERPRTLHGTTTTDPYYADQWNLNGASDSTHGIDAEDAWPTSTGANVVVGVIDTGMTRHSDLSSASSIVGGNVIEGYDFISDPKYSGDGDGSDPDPTDEGDGSEWHGTHVAGIIAAQANNGEGVAGVAPSALIEPLRVLGTDGSGNEDDIIAAISWGAGLLAVDGKVNPHPAAVLNLSLGGSGNPSEPTTYQCSTAMQTAIDDATAHGTAVVVAAGNVPSGYDNRSFAYSQLKYVYPANCQHVIRVTATDKDGTLASYSYYGTGDFPATVAAPGTDIWSTYKDGTTTSGSETYAQMSGTSMATPHVSGVIALIRHVAPTLSVAQIVSLITNTAKPVNGCASAVCGAGIVNAAAAVAAASGPSVAGVTLAKPKMSGRAKIGSTLTSSISGYAPGGATVSLQWLRNGAAIRGETSLSHKLTSADVDATVSVRATADYFGAKAVQTSDGVKVVGHRFTGMGKPKATGSFRVGHKVRAKGASTKPKARSKTYQWLRDGMPIAGATHSSYRLVPEDLGTRVSVTVTVHKSGYSARSRGSTSHKVR